MTTRERAEWYLSRLENLECEYQKAVYLESIMGVEYSRGWNAGWDEGYTKGLEIGQAEVAAIRAEVKDALGCTDGDDIRAQLEDYL